MNRVHIGESSEKQKLTKSLLSFSDSFDIDQKKINIEIKETSQWRVFSYKKLFFPCLIKNKFVFFFCQSTKSSFLFLCKQMSLQNF